MNTERKTHKSLIATPLRNTSRNGIYKGQVTAFADTFRARKRGECPTPHF